MSHTELRNRLLSQRRTRLARNGSLGREIKALHDLATAMDLDRRVICRQGRGTTSYRTIMLSCHRSVIVRQPRTGRCTFAPLRTHRAERDAAEALTDAVVKALGSEYGSTAAEVRAVADRLAAEVMPLDCDTSRLTPPQAAAN